MPAVESVSQVLMRLGPRVNKAWQKTQKEQTEYSKFADLPPCQGVAQLDQIKFGIFQDGANKGKRYFMAMGTVHSPDEALDTNGAMQRVKGLQTRVGPIPLCDTKDRKNNEVSLEEHFSDMCNELRKLMGVKDFGEAGLTNLSELDTVIDTLNKEKPYFRFQVRASKPTPEFPNPRSFHEWHGLYLPSKNGNDGIASNDPAAGTEDETGEGGAVTEEVSTEDAQDDINELVALAETGDDDAISKLQAIAEQFGIDESTVNNTPTWTALGELILSYGTDSAEQGSDDRLTAPEKGEVFYFFPLDKKTKKPATKHVQIEIDTVDSAKTTVSGHNLTNRKIKYSDIPFTALMRDEPKGK